MLSYLSLFLNPTFLNLIVNQSNLYAIQSNTELHLSALELKAVIGMLIIMGFNNLPNMKLYWSGDKNFHNKRIAEIMPLKRFVKIIRFLHLNDNMKMPSRDSVQFDKLYKIRPMIKHLNTVFPEMFSPSCRTSVDESMVAFTGRTIKKHYIHQLIYNISWKSRCWWMKIFYYMLHCSVVNSYVSYKEDLENKNKNYVSHLEFKSVLADELIA